jgi:hypothetical protein
VGQKAAGTGRSLELASASRMQLTAFVNLRHDNLLHPLSAQARHARHVRISSAFGWAMRLGRRRGYGGGRWGRETVAAKAYVPRTLESESEQQSSRAFFLLFFCFALGHVSSRRQVFLFLNGHSCSHRLLCLSE